MDSENGSSDNYLPVGAVIGIAGGAAVLLVVVLVFLFYKLYFKSNNRRSRNLDNTVHSRGISVKQRVLNRSYKQSDNEENIRPVSNETVESFRFDYNDLKTRDNTGRKSYDRPFTVLQQAETEEQAMKRQSLARTKHRIVAGYGEVTLRSQGDLTGVHRNTNSGIQSSNEITTQRNNRYQSATSGDSKTLLLPVGPEPVYSIPNKRYTLRAAEPLPNRLSNVLNPTHPQQHVVYRQTNKRPKHVESNPRISYLIERQSGAQRVDSFRDSHGVDLGADFHKAWHINAGTGGHNQL